MYIPCTHDSDQSPRMTRHCSYNHMCPCRYDADQGPSGPRRIQKVNTLAIGTTWGGGEIDVDSEKEHKDINEKDTKVNTLPTFWDAFLNEGTAYQTTLFDTLSYFCSGAAQRVPKGPKRCPR